MRPRLHIRRLRPLAAREGGGALVEFALLLPVMLLVFAVMIESGRTYWTYQAVISGVREASRYLGRVADGEICEAAGTLAGHEAALKTMIEEVAAGGSLMPPGVSVGEVTATHACVSGAWRVSPAPVATVTAQVAVSYPFAGVFGLLGFSLPTLNTSVADSSRIFGQ